MEPGAAEFAVGDAMQPQVLLEFDDLADGAILDLAQGLRGDGAAGTLLARIEQVLRPQETADMIGAEWRAGAPARCG